MLHYLSYLKNPFVAGLVAGLVITILIYYDNSQNDEYHEFDFGRYLKIFGISAAIIAGIVYYAKSGTSAGAVLMGGGGRGGSSPSRGDFDTRAPDW